MIGAYVGLVAKFFDKVRVSRVARFFDKVRVGLVARFFDKVRVCNASTPELYKEAM